MKSLARREYLRHADNFSPHKRAEVRDWAAAHGMELVFLPTYSSWLNWIESEFAALRYFALNGTNHRSHGDRTPRSAHTSAGTTSTPSPNASSPSTPRSGYPITYEGCLTRH
ncbi:transposase [Nocardia sp. NPDC052112]|uniref:transposase n=1 Tax=Nocardia sp. NPDC052112 TaxID=3155646 RepID=UPI00343C04EB